MLAQISWARCIFSGLSLYLLYLFQLWLNRLHLNTHLRLTQHNGTTQAEWQLSKDNRQPIALCK